MTSEMNSVLVTGADGFIGSHLAEMLCRQGYRVRALVQYNSLGSWGWLEHSDLRSDMEVISGDIRDSHCCREITKDIDTVFHLAALIAIPYSYRAPESYIDTNVTGTLNMCQAALEHRCRRFIHTSTSEVYGTARYVPIDEKHPLQPQSPYSASEIGADAVAMSFHLSFGLPVTIARPFNTYGPRQSARAVIPAIISQLASGMDCIRLGDDRPTRDFNYVEDTCRGFLSLVHCPEAIGETVNIGSNTEVSIAETFAMIASLMGVKAGYQTDEQRVRPADSEVLRLVCDNRKIASLTGYQPSVTLEAGLRRTIDWLGQSENMALYKPDLYHV